MMESKINSIQVGMPTVLGTVGSDDPAEKAWLSGFRKLPVLGPVDVSKTGLAGDGQADLENHGGEDKAILCYVADHYQAWGTELGREKLEFGLFGENLTVDRLTEDQVCIGDTFSIGSVKVQVSQPRQPCWKLGRYARSPELPKKVIQTGFCGWYLRVLQTGVIESGMHFTLDDRPQPDWTVRRAHFTVYAKKHDQRYGDRQQLAALPELSMAWKRQLQSP